MTCRSGMGRKALALTVPYAPDSTHLVCHAPLSSSHSQHQRRLFAHGPTRRSHSQPGQALATSAAATIPDNDGHQQQCRPRTTRKHSPPIRTCSFRGQDRPAPAPASPRSISTTPPHPSGPQVHIVVILNHLRLRVLPPRPTASGALPPAAATPLKETCMFSTQKRSLPGMQTPIVKQTGRNRHA
ncbi:hypothetical protein BD626DRAFT_149580 [Schizophyllum amplum]|uniref:Uncharacterized protein n=1 Tax=Schizophyllum amplum TaxID=97359 RepID=A0A550C3V9_9AGAR|nr:hypothetical protein BD626DRAFT_149580 [Auriculariopsis ampla]